MEYIGAVDDLDRRFDLLFAVVWPEQWWEAAA
jgi:hypothetical protein